MASHTTVKTIMLQSSDEKMFTVPATMVWQSQMINNLIEDMNSKAEGIQVEPTVVSVPHATAEVLKKVITYCEKHAEAEAADATKTHENKAQLEGSNTTPASDEERLDNWDKQFVDVDQAMLFHLLMTAYYLKIDGLLDLACQKVADMLTCKMREELRAVFDILI